MKRNNKSFTLPELLIAAIIMAVVFIMMLTVYANCCSLEEASRNLIVATSHADFVMEDIRNTSFSNLSTDITSGNWNWNSTNITAAQLTPLNNESIATQASGTNPLDITVTVTWRDSQQKNRTKVLETYISG